MRGYLRRDVVRALAVAGAIASLAGSARPAWAARSVGFFPVPGKAPATRTKGAPFAGNAGQCGVITYCGGPVISNVQAQPVYWTNNVSSTITSWAESYLHLLANSELLDMLSEYSTAGQTGEVCTVPTDAGLGYFGPTTASSTGQTITRGTGVSAVTITPTTTTGTTIADDNAAIGAELVAQIAAGKLPAPTYDAQGYPNTLYVVFFPRGTKITLQGMGSCTAFGGYHYSVTYMPNASCKSHYIPYAVIPDCGTQDAASELSGVVSHELAEAVTDTDVGPTEGSDLLGDGAWYLGPSYPCNDPSTCPSNCGEVGDVCENSGGTTVPGSSISSQYIWSQAQNGCDVNNPSTSAQNGPMPLAMCPAGGSSSGGPDAGADATMGGDDGGATSSSSGSGSTSSSGSSSGGSSGGSSTSSGSSSGGGSGSTSSGGSSGGTNGGTSSGSGSSTSSGGFGSSTSSSGSSSGSGNTSSSGASGDDGGFGDTGGGSGGCSCELTQSRALGNFGAFGIALGLGLLARRRRSDSRRR